MKTTKSLLYALIISFILSPGTAQGGCVGSCCGEILEVSHVLLKKEETGMYEDIKIWVTFRNTGPNACLYKVYLYDEWGDETTSAPWGGVYLGPGMEVIIIITDTGLFPGWEFKYIGIRYNITLKTGGGAYLDSVTKSIYETPCEEFLGLHCLNYTGSITDRSGNTLFVCDSAIQPNPDGYCLTRCELTDQGKKCRCSLVQACAEECKESPTGESYCEYEKNFRCEGHYNCTDGATPNVSCGSVPECKVRCAEACGRRTECGDECEDCCKREMCSKANYSREEVEACTSTCEGTCKMRKSVCDIESILTNLAIWIAVAMFTFNAFQLLVSADPEGRDKAKKGIFYVLIGLILFFVTVSLVNYLYGGPDFVCYYVPP